MEANVHNIRAVFPFVGCSCTVQWQNSSYFFFVPFGPSPENAPDRWFINLLLFSQYDHWKKKRIACTRDSHN